MGNWAKSVQKLAWGVAVFSVKTGGCVAVSGWTMLGVWFAFSLKINELVAVARLLLLPIGRGVGRLVSVVAVWFWCVGAWAAGAGWAGDDVAAWLAGAVGGAGNVATGFPADGLPVGDFVSPPLGQAKNSPAHAAPMPSAVSHHQKASGRRFFGRKSASMPAQRRSVSSGLGWLRSRSAAYFSKSSIGVVFSGIGKSGKGNWKLGDCSSIIFQVIVSQFPISNFPISIFSFSSITRCSCCRARANCERDALSVMPSISAISACA